MRVRLLEYKYSFSAVHESISKSRGMVGPPEFLVEKAGATGTSHR
jgi:hypothetical protein